MNGYLFFADFVFWFHWVVVAIIVVGGILIWKCPRLTWFRILHLTTALSTVTSQLIWQGCPLVTLENALRRKDGDLNHIYFGSFLCYYLKTKFGIEVQPETIIFGLVIVTIISLIVSCKGVKMFYSETNAEKITSC